MAPKVEHDILRSLSGRIASTTKDAKETILNLYGRSNRVSVDEPPTSMDVASLVRASSLFQAFAYEDYPDPALESAKTTTITKGPIILKTIGAPPKRPHRPDSWINNGAEHSWTDVSLNGSPTEDGTEYYDHQGNPEMTEQSRCSTHVSSDRTDSRETCFSSMEKVHPVESLSAQHPVGFWHKDLKRERRQLLGRWTLMTLLLSAFVLGMFSLYWAVATTVQGNISSLTVFVVDFETQADALVGPVVRGLTEGIVRNNQTPRLDYVTVSPSVFKKNPLAVREAIWEEQAWAAIVINSNATQLLRQAVGLGNMTYDPNGAIQILYNEAREQDLYFDHIYPMMQKLQTQILHEFGKRWTAEVMSNGAISKTNMALVSQAINPGIGFSTYNIRPFLPSAAMPAVSLGLIYLIIICFSSFSLYLPIHLRLLRGTNGAKIKFWQFILWRWISTVMAYLILSLAFSLISVAFGFPFGNSPGSHLFSATAPSKFYNATFLIYWFINFFGMIALGLACENMTMFLGMQWSGLWLIFWIITNVATAFYAIQLQSGFYRWGYIWPLHNVVEASRSTLFDLRSNLAVNFGVLIIWSVVNTAAFPFACLFVRWKANKAMKKWQQRNE